MQIDFRHREAVPLTPLEIGAGRVERGADAAYLITENATASRYSDAQYDNYAGRKRRDYPCRPPLRMVVRAWASHSGTQLKGTAGFGFWNQPIMPGENLPRLPRYIWFFFGAPPMNMSFVPGVPGYGWKAATADLSRLPFLVLAPFAPLGFLLMRIPPLYWALWPLAQRAIGAAEAKVDADLREPHTYRIDWLVRQANFYVDDELILTAPSVPRGPLGFVAWLDNQYAIVTPQGHLRIGLVEAPGRQWLALESLTIEPIHI